MIQFIVDDLTKAKSLGDVKNLADYDNEPVPGLAFSISDMINIKILELTGWSFLDLSQWSGTPAVYPIFVRHLTAVLSKEKPFTKFLLPQVLSGLQSQKLLLAFIMADEGFEIGLRSIRALRQICAECSIPNDSVVIISSVNQHRMINALRFNFLDKPLVVWSKTARDALRLLEDNGFPAPTYHYICLNRQPKYRRWHLLMSLPEQDARNQLISCHSEKSLGANSYSDTDAEILTRLRAVFPEDQVDNFYKKLPICIDDIGRFNCSMTFLPTLDELRMYRSAAFALVTETALEDHRTNFITEKTFKPIAYRMPFIVSADAGFHTNLVAHGYRLFDMLFDYSFDSLPTIEERNLAIAQQVRALAQWPIERLHTRLSMPDVQEVVAHNYQTLLSNSDTKELFKQLKIKLDNVVGTSNLQ